MTPLKLDSIAYLIDRSIEMTLRWLCDHLPIAGPNFIELLIKHKKQLSTTKLCLPEKGYQPNYIVMCTNCDWYPAHFCFADNS